MACEYVGGTAMRTVPGWRRYAQPCTLEHPLRAGSCGIMPSRSPAHAAFSLSACACLKSRRHLFNPLYHLLKLCMPPLLQHNCTLLHLQYISPVATPLTVIGW
eukprot:1150152-Pelagomonas_calceolata.AAC.3